MDKLQHLFVRPAFPSIWERVGKSAEDEATRSIKINDSVVS